MSGPQAGLVGRQKEKAEYVENTVLGLRAHAKERHSWVAWQNTFGLLGISTLISTVAQPGCIPTSSERGFRLSAAHQPLLSVALLILAILDG